METNDVEELRQWLLQSTEKRIEEQRRRAKRLLRQAKLALWELVDALLALQREQKEKEQLEQRRASL